MHTILTDNSPWLEHSIDDGNPRPAWTLVNQFINVTGYAELQHLDDLVQQRVREQELLYIPHSAGDEDDPRLWHLDPIPMVLSSQEWRQLSDGIAQRAAVLQAFLDDCYGARRWLSEDILPPQLILNNPHFLRPCHGWQPPLSPRLSFYAADVIRCPDGSFQAIADHCQGPAGLGYALENRLLLSRALPQLFANSGVRRLGPFFDAMKRQLESMAQNSDLPRVVLLSDHRHDQGSFEQAYLARYLGFDVIQGRDLMVRGEHVYIKTLGGLQRVDVILRRMADASCDPLHLDGGGKGPPGLLRAVQAGGVVIANALGSSLAEHPALGTYLPQLCRLYLDQDLLLSSPQSWWLQDEQQAEERLSDPQPLLFVQHPEHQVLSNLDTTAEELRQRILSEPQRWSAVRDTSPSRAPTWQNGFLGQNSLSLRLFALNQESSWTCMPGAVARSGTANGLAPLLARRGGGCKDTWVLSDEDPENLPPPLQIKEPVTLRRGGVDVPSLLLDDLFWLGRYAERAEALARICRCALGLEAESRLGQATIAGTACREILAIMGAIPNSEDQPGDETLLIQALINEDQANSLCQVLKRLSDLSNRVRSRLSHDAGRSLFALATLMEEATIDSQRRLHSGTKLCDAVIDRCAALAGALAENAVRGHAWSFLDLGRRIERSCNTVLVMQSAVPAGLTAGHLEMALDIADSLLTYRARYRSRLQPAPVVDLLLADETNPRSLLFQLRAMQNRFQALPRDDSQVGPWPAEAIVISLSARIVAAEISSLCAEEGAPLRALLHESLGQLWECSHHISTTWFSHIPQHSAEESLTWLISGGDHA